MAADPTPADLALELGVAQRRIRALLRGQYGRLGEGVTRWRLTKEQEAFVRTHLGGRTTREWALQPGDTVRRAAIHESYRGQQRGGISTPVGLGEVLIFTSPQQGARYGYDRFEGLQEDGTYSYTGEGQVGDMTWVRGNKAILRAGAEGRPIRLLVTDGTAATYVGSFTTADPPYRWETIPDVNGDDRAGIIFNLTPLQADSSLLPPIRQADSPGQARSGGDASESVAAGELEWQRPASSAIEVRPAETVEPQGASISRVEMALQADFGAWLVRQGSTPKRLLLSVDGTRITPDLYVPDRGWVVEAKKSSGRAYVRSAIGQVLDYAHVARLAGYDVQPAVLLPGRPAERLVELLRTLGITLIFRDEDLGFQIEM